MSSDRRIRFARPRKIISERIIPSGAHPIDPIVRHEDGMWSVWHDSERYPSYGFARAVWLASRRTIEAAT
jgi:hypothetical protein